MTTSGGITITVRDSGGTYIARGGGKTASCTAGRLFAARALCQKLFKGDFKLANRHANSYYVEGELK